MKKIHFKGFWAGFDCKTHSAFNWIVDHFGLEVNQHNPDIIVYGYPAPDPTNDEKCIKVFFTGESVSPDFNKYDFAFTFDYSEDPRNFRFPLYLWSHENYHALKNREIKDWASEKTKFCNFIYGNGDTSMDGVRRRIDFFKKLSEYKRVDSGGYVLNNIGHTVDNKIEWLRDYKFTIAFENRSYKGYTTEKILDPLIANSLPLYSGNPLIDTDFNAGSFINCDKFETLDEAISKIIEIDQNDELYNSIMNHRIIPDILPECASKDWYIDCWNKIIKSCSE